MPAKKKSSLSSKSKKSRKNKLINESLSEEDYYKMLQSKRLSTEKSRQNQSFEEKEIRLEGQRNRDKLNNSQILREHKSQVLSQVCRKKNKRSFKEKSFE